MKRFKNEVVLWLPASLILVILALSVVDFELFKFSRNTVMMILSLLGFFWLVWHFWKSELDENAKRVRIRFFVGGGLVLALMALYYLNPSYRWEDHVGALPIDHIRFLPGATYPVGALSSLLFALLLFVVFGLVRDLGRKQRSVLIAVIVAIGTITSMAVIGQRLTPQPFYLFDLTGFFPYENHFAAFANMILPVALFSAANQRERAYQTGRVSSPAGITAWAAIMMIGAIVVSRSRAGFVVAGCSFFLFVVLQILRHRRDPFSMPPVSLLTKVGLGLGGIAAIGTSMWGLVREWNGLSRIGGELSFRGQILMDTVLMWKEHPWWGMGPGSFAAIFPYYQSLSVEKHFIRHAHCEPVEFLAEYGLLGGGFLLVCVAWVLFPRIFRFPVLDFKFQFLKFLSFSSGIRVALLAVGLHGLIDFPFRHPLVALLTVVWMGILTANVKSRPSAS